MYIKQLYYNKLFHQGNLSIYSKIIETNYEINAWFEEEAKNILTQINMNEITESEQIHMYHHEILRKKVTKSAILELKTENGNILGHKQCSDFICNSVAELLENPFNFNSRNQEVLLEEVEEVFSKDDNNMLLKLPSKEEIKEIIKN